MQIISLSGKKSSGKTTAAKLIKEIIHQYNPKLTVDIINFADALKQEVARACNCSVNYIEEHKPNFRLLLQGWGTDFRRELTNKDYWAEKLLKLLINSKADISIVGDVRFVNEAKILKEVGSLLWRVERNRHTKDLAYDDKHISETELDTSDFDRVIFNNGSLGELRGTLVSELEMAKIIKLN